MLLANVTKLCLSVYIFCLIRLDEAIEILEHVVGMREEKLGTANPDVDNEKQRLAELLKEAGRVRSRKAKSLENLLETNPYTSLREIQLQHDPFAALQGRPI
jgi:hypothetical protein